MEILLLKATPDWVYVSFLFSFLSGTIGFDCSRLLLLKFCKVALFPLPLLLHTRCRSPGAECRGYSFSRSDFFLLLSACFAIAFVVLVLLGWFFGMDFCIWEMMMF